jgi:hypothetical protein
MSETLTESEIRDPWNDPTRAPRETWRPSTMTPKPDPLSEAHEIAARALARARGETKVVLSEAARAQIGRVLGQSSEPDLEHAPALRDQFLRALGL